MTKTKRTYKHSEAWLAKHAAKADAKKDAIKPKAKAKAKKMAKKAMKPKKAKKVGKDIMKKATKLFGVARKAISATKKQTKAYGKLVTEAYKTGDEKTLERVLKLFGRLGFTKFGDDCIISNTFTVKVKIPKAKALKKVDDAVPDGEVKPLKKKRRSSNAETGTGETPSAVTVNDLEVPQGEPADPLPGPTDDDLNEIENENDPADASNEGNEDGEGANDDEADNEPEDTSRDGDPIFDDNSIRGRDEVMRDIEADMQDNGDW